MPAGEAGGGVAGRLAGRLPNPSPSLSLGPTATSAIDRPHGSRLCGSLSPRPHTARHLWGWHNRRPPAGHPSPSITSARRLARAVGPRLAPESRRCVAPPSFDSAVRSRVPWAVALPGWHDRSPPIGHPLPSTQPSGWRGAAEPEPSRELPRRLPPCCTQSLGCGLGWQHSSGWHGWPPPAGHPFPLPPSARQPARGRRAGASLSPLLPPHRREAETYRRQRWRRAAAGAERKGRGEGAL